MNTTLSAMMASTGAMGMRTTPRNDAASDTECPSVKAEISHSSAVPRASMARQNTKARWSQPISTCVVPSQV